MTYQQPDTAQANRPTTLPLADWDFLKEYLDEWHRLHGIQVSDYNLAPYSAMCGQLTQQDFLRSFQYLAAGHDQPTAIAVLCEVRRAKAAQLDQEHPGKVVCIPTEPLDEFCRHAARLLCNPYVSNVKGIGPSRLGKLTAEMVIGCLEDRYADAVRNPARYCPVPRSQQPIYWGRLMPEVERIVEAKRIQTVN